MSIISSKDVQRIKEFIDEHSDIFQCDCEPYLESDTNAWIHNEEKCAAFMESHTEITLTRLIEWLQEHGPIQVRGW